MIDRKAAGAVTEERKRNISFILTIILSSVYLIWRIFFTIPWGAGILQAAAGVMLAAAEGRDHRRHDRADGGQDEKEKSRDPAAGCP